MSTPPRQPPRFVPTLTDIVADPPSAGAGYSPGSEPISEPAPRALPPLHGQAVGGGGVAFAPSGHYSPSVPPAASVWPSPLAEPPVVVKPQASAPHPGMPLRPLPDGAEEYMVHRVLQRVDLVLDQRLRDAIATVVQEQTRSVLPRLREEIESVVRNAVYEAVADELAAGTSGGPLR